MGMGWVTRVLIRCCFDGQGWGGLGWGGSDFLGFQFAVRNRVYLFGTHAGSLVHHEADQVVPKWFRRWFRNLWWFRVVPCVVVPTGSGGLVVVVCDIGWLVRWLTCGLVRCLGL